MRREPIEVTERTYAERRAARNVVIMEMPTAYGPLGRLTGAQGRRLTGWQSELFKNVADAAVLDNVMTEDKAHAILDRWVLSSQQPRRCKRCGKPIDAAFYYNRVGIYCSYDCATSGRRDRYAATQGAARAAARAGRRCERCGAPIRAKRSTKRFCSTKCRIAAFRAAPP
jgi:hypothetical protein